MQQRVVDVAKSGEVYRSPALVEALTVVVPPVSYLDFETFNPAIPLYPNTSPYERIPFEWSLHHNDGSDVLIHLEFLADGQIDPRRDFTQTLLVAVERLPGPVTVWSSFEAIIIRELAGLFPDLADRLMALLDRIVDLLPIVRKHVAHPGCHGSYSMKSVAPIVAPEIVYDGHITQGSEASAVFYRILTDPTLTSETRGDLRQALLTYCANDSMGIARVHQWLKTL